MEISLNFKDIPDKKSLYAALGAHISFPPHFGCNADALYDVITELSEKPVIHAANEEYAPKSVLPDIRALKDCTEYIPDRENSLLRADFFYDLPEELIAQTPAEPRNTSRLLCLGRESGDISEDIFKNLSSHLKAGDLLVMNDSRVIPARLYGKKEGSGGAMEFLLLEPKGDKVWEIMVRPGKKAKPGSRFVFGDGILRAEILETVEGGNRIARFECEDNIYTVLDRIGQMPLPPYITEKLKDKERYQTVYSNEPGSAAAPTAGLHFTEEQLESLRAEGIKTAFVTLHVGLGTFRPVKERDALSHKMHSEHFLMPAHTADLINDTKAQGGRVIAVGTTATRTLESIAVRFGEIRECEGDTDIFIYPGYRFKAIDGLITNFHLPESTLIMLVCAFAGYHNTMEAYKYAVENRFRFFSFGDAMLIL